MAYVNRVVSDSTKTTVLDDTALTASGVNTTATTVTNYREIDWWIKITSRSSATTLTVKIQFADNTSPASADWATLHSESISSGTATQSQYAMSFTLSGSDPITVPVTAPVRGTVMRLNLTTDANTAATDVTVIRRV